MNNWTIVGVICFCIGVVVLLAGIGLGFAAMSAFDLLSGFLGTYGTQLKQTAFMATATPYLIGSAAMFIIGVVGLFAGSSQAKQNVYSQAPKIQGAMAKCPSCGQPMVFIEKYQKWYCPKENFYL